MNRFYPWWKVILLCLLTSSLTAQDFKLDKISTFNTGIFDEGAAEILDYDPLSNSILFTNANNNSVTVLDISRPNAPVLVREVSMESFGSGVNSLSVHEGLVAVAVEGKERTAPGAVVLMRVDGTILNVITVGVLPDMVTFTPDGTKILTANEGEPDDDYVIDPEGSISIIDVTFGPQAASHTLLTFESFNDKKVSLQNRGIRLFGPNATVAQDLEPEFVAVTEDGTRAYVACQENNAYAVVDLTTSTLIDLLPLGVKDHSKGSPILTNVFLNEINNWPALGTPLTENAAPVLLGGFSGLYFDANESTDDEYVFYTIPDRGPNEASVNRNSVVPATSQNVRPFKLPNYQARIVKITLNRNTGEASLDGETFLTTAEGNPISGRGNIPGFDEVPVTRTVAGTAFGNVDFVGPDGTEYHALDYDPFGGDFEGILKDNEGNFWMCDEYRPAVYKFRPNGELIDRYVPEGTSLLGTDEMPAGFYGLETLPAVYAKRRANRGFEAIAYDGEQNIVYSFIQTPLYNPSSVTRNLSDVIRILGIDAATGTPVSEYVYLLENNANRAFDIGRVDKIGDAVYIGNGQFLVLERDSSVPGQDEGKKYVFKIDLKGATNILGTELANTTVEPTLEQLSADELAAAGVQAVNKIKVLNLPSIGYQASDKPEGLAYLPGGSIAVLNDNDFGLAGAGITDNSILGIIDFDDNYGLDASNRTDDIEIRNWPTYGIFHPDAIATVDIFGKTYILSANEGDARDYDGFSEEERVKDLNLDPDVFPNADALQEDEALGRLKTTIANGDIDGDGDFD
ncbi:MAG: esterase-like activity of phytase family protein, partial [Bacteroidota bacterium]